jgi:hypothetical protein
MIIVDEPDRGSLATPLSEGESRDCASLGY